jgi:hypothetical protein
MEHHNKGHISQCLSVISIELWALWKEPLRGMFLHFHKGICDKKMLLQWTRKVKVTWCTVRAVWWMYETLPAKLLQAGWYLSGYLGFLEPSDHFLGLLKKLLGGHRCQTDAEVQEGCSQCFLAQRLEFYDEGIHSLIMLWQVHEPSGWLMEKQFIFLISHDKCYFEQKMLPTSKYLLYILIFWYNLIHNNIFLPDLTLVLSSKPPKQKTILKMSWSCQYLLPIIVLSFADILYHAIPL